MVTNATDPSDPFVVETYVIGIVAACGVLCIVLCAVLVMSIVCALMYDCCAWCASCYCCLKVCTLCACCGCGGWCEECLRRRESFELLEARRRRDELEDESSEAIWEV